MLRYVLAIFTKAVSSISMRHWFDIIATNGFTMTSPFSPVIFSVQTDGVEISTDLLRGLAEGAPAWTARWEGRHLTGGTIRAKDCCESWARRGRKSTNPQTAAPAFRMLFRQPFPHIFTCSSVPPPVHRVRDSPSKWIAKHVTAASSIAEAEKRWRTSEGYQSL